MGEEKKKRDGIEVRISTRTGEISYRAKVRVKGYPPQTATFKSKTAAKRWAQKTEADIREDRYFPNAKAKKFTVADLIDTYLENMKVRNPRRHGEIKALLDWWKAEVGQTVLSHFKGEQVLRAQQKLLGRRRHRKGADGTFPTLSPGTVNRYMQTLQAALNFGIRPLKWISDNPVKDVDKLKEPPGRTRFL
ncbi:MAG TPA: site-specific integrase, partial [Alphaproteobacteria bacterium]